MKYLILILFFISCSAQKVKDSTLSLQNLPHKYKYLKEFYQLRDLLKIETKRCKEYSNQYISNVVEANKNLNILNVLKNYDPHNFDWHTSSKIKTLYLDYPYDEAISQEHFEITNNLKDCGIEFDNLNFLNNAVSLYVSKNADSTLKKQVIITLKRYLKYIDTEEVSLLNVLITNSILIKLEENKIIEFNDKDEYLKRVKFLEFEYIQTGKNVLNFFRDKNFQEIYNLDQKLRSYKKDFKSYMFKSYHFL